MKIFEEIDCVWTRLGIQRISRVPRLFGWNCESLAMTQNRAGLTPARLRVLPDHPQGICSPRTSLDLLLSSITSPQRHESSEFLKPVY